MAEEDALGHLGGAGESGRLERLACASRDPYLVFRIAFGGLHMLGEALDIGPSLAVPNCGEGSVPQISVAQISVGGRAGRLLAIVRMAQGGP